MSGNLNAPDLIERILLNCKSTNARRVNWPISSGTLDKLVFLKRIFPNLSSSWRKMLRIWLILSSPKGRLVQSSWRPPISPLPPHLQGDLDLTEGHEFFLLLKMYKNKVSIHNILTPETQKWTV